MKRNSYTTKRLEIRAYTLKDYKAWFEAYTESLPKSSKHDVEPYLASECSKQVFKTFVVKHRELAKIDRTYIWGIYDKKSGVQVGTIDIHILVRDELQKANLGYRIFNRYWRKGFAKEAVKKICKEALIDLKLNRLEAVIDSDNMPSIKLAKSLGFRSEGVRENYFFQDDRWDDQAVFVVDRKLLKLPALKPW
ncbi:MAG: hypothetical protein CME71_01950 [Halobacteriovorax sp.]|nr:hypothetical protein [Halobacteriovorax sp.]|tara:strand:- start:1320 stop:1898 length:579 start_codon:yes stop_codon:yes gene_type:complete